LKVIGLDNREYSWNPKSGGGKRSKLHQKAKEVLDSCFPYDRILEEVSLPGTRTVKNKSLRADFYIPNRTLIVEVHGQQHFKFNSFHFKDKLSFFRAQARDRSKVEWCSINDIRMVELNYDEDIDEWRNKIE
tara:strand:- start:88 stop:483 length:396 start_codon:yes stop_codon:yes gene_type:complete